MPAAPTRAACPASISACTRRAAALVRAGLRGGHDLWLRVSPAPSYWSSSRREQSHSRVLASWVNPVTRLSPGPRWSLEGTDCELCARLTSLRWWSGGAARRADGTARVAPRAASCSGRTWLLPPDGRAEQRRPQKAEGAPGLPVAPASQETARRTRPPLPQAGMDEAGAVRPGG